MNLEVRLRKRERRQPVILNCQQVLQIIEKIEPKYRPGASLQDGAGLRLKELVSLRIKDIDLERGVVTIRGGKGDRGHLSIIPDSLKQGLAEQIALSRELWEKDRLEYRPGVALPLALAKKMPRTGERWAWQKPIFTMIFCHELWIITREYSEFRILIASLRSISW